MLALGNAKGVTHTEKESWGVQSCLRYLPFSLQERFSTVFYFLSHLQMNCQCSSSGKVKDNTGLIIDVREYLTSEFPPQGKIRGDVFPRSGMILIYWIVSHIEFKVKVIVNLITHNNYIGDQLQEALPIVTRLKTRSFEFLAISISARSERSITELELLILLIYSL